METTGTIEEKKQESVQSEPKKAMVSPGQLRIIKRNGSVVDFDGSKIEIAITKAFWLYILVLQQHLQAFIAEFQL